MNNEIRYNAFSLVEVTLALGVVAVCLVAVFGLLPIGFNTHRSAVGQSTAVDILSAVTSDLRATPNTATNSRQFDIAIDALNPALYFDETGNLTATADRQVYRLTVTFPTNSLAPSRGATFATLKVTWPAQVDPATTTPAGAAEMFTALDRH